MPIFQRRIGGADLKTNPYFNERQYVGTTGYYKDNKNYQCVNYVAGRVSELSECRCFNYGSKGELPEIKSDNPLFKLGYGNAKNWWDNSLWEKTTQADEVRLGDIVVYGSGWGKGYGHVRIVEAIEDNYLILSGGNEDGKGTCKFNIKQIKCDGGGSEAKGLVGYIHNMNLTTYIPPITDYKTKYEEALKDLRKIKEIVDKYE